MQTFLSDCAYLVNHGDESLAATSTGTSNGGLADGEMENGTPISVRRRALKYRTAARFLRYLPPA